MPQPIQLKHSLTTTTAPPATAYPGEVSFALLPAGLTRMWVMDGTAQRFLFSSDPNDALGVPIIGGQYLPLVGGTMQGPIVQSIAPAVPFDLANKEYVDLAVTDAVHYQGIHDPTTAPPTAVPPPNEAGDFWIADPAGASAAGFAPGIATGTPIASGDWLIWSGTQWSHLPGGQLTIQEADARYVNIAGDVMTGPATLTLPLDGAIGSMEAVTVQQLEAAIASIPPPVSSVTTDDSLTGDGFTVPLGILLVTTDAAQFAGTGAIGDPLNIILIDGGTF
jgi:hypothetical protein